MTFLPALCLMILVAGGATAVPAVAEERLACVPFRNDLVAAEIAGTVPEGPTGLSLALLGGAALLAGHTTRRRTA